MKEDAKKELAYKRHMKIVWTWIIILLVFIIIIGGITWYKNIPPTPGKYDAFAQCIASSGAQFYGAFWCPHCQAQKAEFGDAEKYLPYVECSAPDGNSELQACTDKGVKGYPTWFFKDGSTLTGTQDLSVLAQKTGCTLP
jgi:hypothetical protein